MSLFSRKVNIICKEQVCLSVQGTAPEILILLLPTRGEKALRILQEAKVANCKRKKLTEVCEKLAKVWIFSEKALKLHYLLIIFLS